MMANSFVDVVVEGFRQGAGRERALIGERDRPVAERAQSGT
jgi:hypothetical protein